MTAIKALIADLPDLRLPASARASAPPGRDGRPRVAANPKRVYRVMKAYGLLLQRHSGRGEKRRHEGRVSVDVRNTRRCSGGLEIGCDNGEKVRVAFALDRCDRETMGYVATTSGISAEDVRDLMVASVKHRSAE